LPRLSVRLSSIVDFVSNKKENVICDIGCDHGYVGISLLLQHKAAFIYNIDIRKNPLLNAIKNFQKYDLLKYTKNINCDGLKTDEISKPIDFCIISGLGDKTIFEIIKKRDKKIKIKD
jgi:tRNA (adenine22-N1)-methyltransferase